LLVMALIELSSAQTQEDWALAKIQAEMVFENVNLEITNPPREPLDRIAMCRRLLPRVDDAFRVVMAYGRAANAGEQAEPVAIVLRTGHKFICDPKDSTALVPRRPRAARKRKRVGNPPLSPSPPYSGRRKIRSLRKNVGYRGVWKPILIPSGDSDAGIDYRMAHKEPEMFIPVYFWRAIIAGKRQRVINDAA